MTGLPVKFLGTGEKTDALEPFHPDRLAGRILGMGDVLTLVERAQDAFDQKQAEKTAARLQSGSFTLEDMLEQLQQVKKMGPLGQVIEMIPGMGGMAKEAQDSVDRGDLKRTEAIIRSMTPGSGATRRPQREPATPHRGRVRDLDRRGQPAGQAVHRHAEAHEAAPRGSSDPRDVRPLRPGGIVMAEIEPVSGGPAAGPGRDRHPCEATPVVD